MTVQLAFRQVRQDQAVPLFLFHCFTYLCTSWRQGRLRLLPDERDKPILLRLVVLDASRG